MNSKIKYSALGIVIISLSLISSACSTLNGGKSSGHSSETSQAYEVTPSDTDIQTSESVAERYGQKYQTYVNNLKENGYTLPEDMTPIGAMTQDTNVCSYLRSGTWNIDTLVRLGKVTTDGDEDGERIKAMIPFMCPDQQSKIDSALSGNSRQESFTDGNYTVSASYTAGQYSTSTVQPGVWKTRSSVTNCYWERGDGNGNIIDNNFVTFSPELTVTILETDVSFVSNGCGQWIRQ